ncbi:MAG TPA: phosphatidylserine decarboxylase [Blastocatellia bacterium]|jgi:phosphatidylserine decarboxylase|nr:phosphatidylserine decarboxylase [Blastocatellia bacterium]
MEPIMLYNRKTGSLQEEAVFEKDVMEFLYGSRLGFFITELLFKHRWATELYARLQHGPGSKSKIRKFVDSHGVNLDELDRPIGSFNTFNEFFIRRLKPSARPIDRAPASLISIADCRLSVYPIREDAVYPVKAGSFTIARLLGDEQTAVGYAANYAANYAGGLCLIFRLAPVDYHRFGYVDDCDQSPVESINGFYRSVHPLSLRRMKAVFTENRREFCILKTMNFGEVLHIDVGATGVGRIVQNHPGGGRFTRGEEKGYFEFGGSTVILLLKPGAAKIDDDIASFSGRGIETIVRYGEKIGCRPLK